MAVNDAAISIRDLVVDRGGHRVLDGVSVEVAAGRITGLLGPSGCGKSTLMRSIVGVQIVASGQVDVLGMPAGSPGLRSDVGYVTQAPSVYLDLTARQNLDYFAAVLDPRTTRAERHAQVERALADVDHLALAHDVQISCTGHVNPLREQMVVAPA